MENVQYKSGVCATPIQRRNMYVCVCVWGGGGGGGHHQLSLVSRQLSALMSNLTPVGTRFTHTLCVISGDRGGWDAGELGTGGRGACEGAVETEGGV